MSGGEFVHEWWCDGVGMHMSGCEFVHEWWCDGVGIYISVILYVCVV